MNKKVFAAAALAATSAFAFTTWSGDKAVYQVETGFGNETKTQGYWFSYGDDSDGGKSTVQWPVAKGNEYSADALDPIIDFCKGVCGTAVLNAGTLTYDPYVGIGINVVGETSATDKTPAATNASAMGGVCIAYSSDAGAALELGLGDAGDQAIGYANPAATLPAGNNQVKDLTWADFTAPTWAATQTSGADAAAKLVAIKFKIQAKAGSYKFNIMSIGANGGGCATTGGTLPEAIAPSTASSVKAMLSGRTLSFSGISSAVSAEVINLQGRVVVKSTLNGASSLNLSNLDAGVYMVRVAGQAVSFSQKIILK